MKNPLGSHASGPRGCVVVCLFGIAGLSLDNLSRCAVAHLHYVHSGLQGIAVATVEVVDVCDVRIAHALGSDSLDASHVNLLDINKLLPPVCLPARLFLEPQNKRVCGFL